jgi:Right handed beta helix region
MRRLLGLVVAAVAATLLFALSAGQALANPPCGSTITQDTTLDGDLFCPADGLKIASTGSQRITLNLNGFTVYGPISGGSRFEHLQGPREVENGSVVGSTSVSTFVALSWGEISVHDLVLRDAALSIGHAFDARVERNSVIGSFSFGISFDRGNGIISDNHVSGAAGPGIAVTNSLQVSLDQNQTDSNDADGISVEHSGPVSVTNSHAWFNGGHGIEVTFSDASGSGNWAKHNAANPQCVGPIQCSTTGKPKG